MTASILVATPHPPFGELLRISLEDSGQYQVRLVQSAKEARAASGRVSFQLAILDSSLTGEPFTSLCSDLLQQQPGMRLVVIPPDNNPNHPSLGVLLPHGYLSRPFYLPDLLATISRLLEERERELNPGSSALPPASSPQALPAWLQEPLTLTAYLKKEISSTSAQAGILGLSDPAQRSATVRAWTGDLSAEAAEEMAGVVFRYWDRGEKTDLMRYLRLSSNKKDYLVYAAQVSGDMALILAYDTAAPLSQIRPQTRQVAHTLASEPPEGFDSGIHLRRPQGAEPAAQPPAHEPDPQAVLPGGTVSTAANEPLTQPAQHDDARHAYPDLPAEEDEEADFEGELINLASLLGEVPPPDPAPDKGGPKESGWHFERPGPDHNPTLPGWMNGWESIVRSEAPPPAPAAAGTAANDDTQALRKPEKPARPAQPEPGQAAQRDTRPAPAAQPNTPPVSPPQAELDLVEPPPDPLEDTRPGVISTITQLTQLEASPPALSLLNYTCVLVPRMPGHYLTGELADRLSQWVAQLCLAFGWRLEGIAVRPEYLQWSVQVAPAVSPGNVVRILRQRTSQNIFQTYAGFASDNPSGDFWAPGYLIVSGPQPPSAQLLRDYILRTRKRQGLIK